MIPLVSTVEEFTVLKEDLVETIHKLEQQAGEKSIIL